MSVFLSPVGGAGAQFFDNNGNPLTGGKLYTYAAGTTTPAVTYTSSAGNTAHSNPIILDAAGRVPGSSEIWLTDSVAYKFVLKDSNDVLQATWDNITGINSNFVNFTAQEEVQTATAGQTVFTLADITYTPGSNNLQVFVDGVNQIVDDSYLETNSTTVTFVSGLHVGALVKFTTAVSNSSGIETDAALVTYDPPFTGSIATNVEVKLAEIVNVKDFGAAPSASASANRAAIQTALDASAAIEITEDYLIDAAIFPNTGNRIYFRSGKLTASQIISGDECVIKVANATDVEIHNANIDCGNFASNSGIIVRENTANVRIYNTKVVNAVWDTITGGGRAIIVEANTGTVGKIIIDGLTAIDVDTVIGLNGYYGSRKNAVIVNNVIGQNVNKLIVIWGNGGGVDPYPHTGDSQQFTVSNVTGYSVAQPIRFDRGGNTIISNVYVYNTPAYGAITSVVRGTANNIRCTNVIMEGDIASLYDGTPWNDQGTVVDLGFDTQKCHFGITHRGTASSAALTAGITRSTLVSNTVFDLNTDVITTDLVSNTQMRVNTSAYVSIYSCQHNGVIKGFVSELGATLISAVANKSDQFVANTFTPVVVGSTGAGTGTYTVQQGNYTIIGNRAFFNLYLTWTAHTGTGNIWIEGLPVSVSTSNTQSALAVAFVNNITTSAGNIVTAHKDVGNGRIVLGQYPTGGGAVTSVPMDVAGAIMISGNYLVS